MEFVASFEDQVLTAIGQTELGVVHCRLWSEQCAGFAVRTESAKGLKPAITE